MTDLETRVPRFVAEQLSVPVHALSDSTTLFGDLGVDGDDAVELLTAFREAFDVDLDGLDPARYFGPEGWWPWAPAEWLRQAARGGTREARAGLEPLTLGDLVRAATSGGPMPDGPRPGAPRSPRRPRPPPLCSLLAALSLAACGGGAGDESRPPGVGAAFFAAQTVGIEEVTVAVPLSPEISGEGRCDEPVELPGGETVLALWWADDGEVLRRVNLRLDAAGEPGSYSDLRGGMTNVRTMGTDVPGTTITLMFPTRLALVRNQGVGERKSFRVPFEDALHSGALDRPADRIAELRERCGGSSALLRRAPRPPG